MKRIDTRTYGFPLILVHHKMVQLVLSAENSQYFSIKAWNFFASVFDEVIASEPRYSPNQFDTYIDLGGNPKRAMTNHEETASVAIYPGSYLGEWFLQFYEKAGDEDGEFEVEARFITHLRTTRAQGSVDKREALRELFQKV